jgi:hypothetical protein
MGTLRPRAARRLGSTGLVSLLVLVGVLCSGAPALAGECPNEQVRVEQGSTHLPECRAYEMVSPVYKGGYAATLIEGVAPDGQSAAFGSQGTFSGAPASNPLRGFYLARRGAAEWQTGSLITPATVAPEGLGVEFFSANLGLVLFQGEPGPDTGAAGYTAVEKDFFVHPTDTPDTPENWTLAGMALQTLEKGSFHSSAMNFVGESESFSHILFFGSLTSPLLPAAVGSVEPLYDLQTQLSGGEPSLRLVDVTNNIVEGEPEPIDPHCPVELGSISAGAIGSRGSGFNAVSADGGTVFFTTCGGTYARVGGEKTLRISAPVAVDCASSAPCHSAAQAPALFQGASQDGSRVFFTTTQPLVTGDTDTGSDLYMASVGCPGGGTGCEASQQEVTSMVQVSHDANVGEAAGVQGVVRVAQDGSRVYFVARGVLGGAGAVGAGVQAQPVRGADNLYVYDAASETTGFVADLCSGPGSSGEVEDQRCPLDNERGDTNLWLRVPDVQLNGCAGGEPACEAGRFLVFDSAARLVSGDTNSVVDVYRYDARSGVLQRVSIGEEGADANGNGGAFDASIRSVGLGGHAEEEVGLGSRAVSDDGSRVVFMSARPLSERAGSGVASAYEWHQASGEGGGGEGRVALVSGAGFTEPVEDVVISPSGRDIFFVTAQGLVVQDGDGQPDVYDARIDGGFTPPPVARQACAGEACYGPLTNPAPLLVPGSVPQAPGGNFAAPAVTVKPKARPVKCGKGFTRKHNRCMKRKAKKARRAGHNRGAHS